MPWGWAVAETRITTAIEHRTDREAGAPTGGTTGRRVSTRDRDIARLRLRWGMDYDDAAGIVDDYMDDKAATKRQGD